MASEVLRRARRRAGLTQVDLARRAQVAQSVVSAYESGHRQPSLPALMRLIDAAGSDLRLVLEAQPAGLDRLAGPIGRRVRRHRAELATVAAASGVTRLAVFGSVARGQEGPDSDVDLLIEVPPGLGLLGIGRLREQFEDIVGASVDLVPSGDLKPEVRERVAADLVEL
jgi:predicted nucleotidyltransferase/DNA-binding XRE family transcriptional regulator